MNLQADIRFYIFEYLKNNYYSKIKCIHFSLNDKIISFKVFRANIHIVILINFSKNCNRKSLD